MSEAANVLSDSRCPCPNCIDGRNKVIRELRAERDVLKADLTRARFSGELIALEAMRLRSLGRRRGEELDDAAEDLRLLEDRCRNQAEMIGRFQRTISDLRGELAELKAERRRLVDAKPPTLGTDIEFTKDGFPRLVQSLYP